MKNLYSRLTLITSVVLITGYLIVSAAWTSMGNVGTGDQLSATLWNTLLDNTRDLDTRIKSISSVWPSVTGGIAYTGGNVGIGAVPQTTLSVYKPIIWKTTSVADSHVYLRGADNGYGLALGVSNSATAGFLQTKLNDISANLPLLLNPDGGNIGIGTVSPWSKLHVVDGISNLRFGHNLSAGSSGPSLMLETSSNVYSDVMWNTFGSDQVRLRGSSYGLAIGGTNPRLNIGYADANYTSATLAVNGNVGIGTTTPRAALEVAGRNVIFGTTPTTIGYASSGYPGIGYNFSAQTDGTWKYLISDTAYMIGLGQGHRFDFNYAPAGVAGNVISWATAMSVLNNGDVGIGTISPQGKLDVRGAVIVATPDYALGSVGSMLAVGMGAASGNTYAFLDSYVGGATAFGNIVLHPTGNGNVGIGIPSPSTKLDVLGTIRNSAPSAGYLELSGDLPGYGANTYPTLKTSGGALYFSVWGAYSAWMSAGWVLTAISDKNKKENFQDLDYGEILGKIDAMPLKEWNYKMEDKSIRHIGPFAQDFHALFGLNGLDDKMISNIDPTGVALAGIKWLSEKSKTYESQIADLKTANTALQDRIDTLQSLVCLDHPTAQACK